MELSELNPALFGVGQYRVCLLPEPDYIGDLQKQQPVLYQFFKERVLDKPEEEIQDEERHEQGSVAWKNARTKNPRLPASSWPKVAKNCPYTTDYTALVQDMLYSEFTGNVATEHGNTTEPIARVRFIRDHTELIRSRVRKALDNDQTEFVYAGKKRTIPAAITRQTPLTDDLIRKHFLTVVVTGLHVFRSQRWLACSSDGDVNDDIVLEIKCPHKKPPYALLPLYYWDQLQGNMHLRARDRLFFYVYTDRGITCELIWYDASYCNGYLVPCLNRFYFHHFLPAFFQREQQAHALLVGLNALPVVETQEEKEEQGKEEEGKKQVNPKKRKLAD